MEMNYFDEFVELARVRSYTTAAHNLHISQSVLSKHIKMMENELGIPLFIRNKGGIELNEYGQLLIPHANQIVNIKETYVKEISSHQNKESSLYIASIPAVKQLGIGEMIVGFTKENPKISINILEGENAYLIDCLQKQEYDVAFARGEDNRYSELVRIPYMNDRIVAMMPTSHPLATKEEVSLTELKYENLIFSDTKTYMYHLVSEVCHREGFEPNVVYTNNNGWHSVEMVAKCVGIALMNQRTTGGYVERYSNIKLLKLKPAIESCIYMYYNPRHLTPIADLFVNYVIERVKEKK